MALKSVCEINLFGKTYVCTKFYGNSSQKSWDISGISNKKDEKSFRPNCVNVQDPVSLLHENFPVKVKTGTTENQKDQSELREHKPVNQLPSVFTLNCRTIEQLTDQRRETCTCPINWTQRGRRLQLSVHAAFIKHLLNVLHVHTLRSASTRTSEGPAAERAVQQRGGNPLQQLPAPQGPRRY